MDNIKEMVAILAPKMKLRVDNKRKLGREFVVQEPLKKEMPRECFIDNDTLGRAPERIHKREEDIKKESRDKMFKRFKKIAVWGGIILVAVIGVGFAHSKLSEGSKKDEPEKQWPVDPISFTSADIESDVENISELLGRKPNWIHTQEETDYCGNPNGESIFIGYENDDGTTDWYTSDGFLDCTTSTPSEDSPEWAVDIFEGNITQV